MEAHTRFYLSNFGAYVPAWCRFRTRTKVERSAHRYSFRPGCGRAVQYQENQAGNWSPGHNSSKEKPQSFQMALEIKAPTQNPPRHIIFATINGVKNSALGDSPKTAWFFVWSRFAM